MTRQSITSALLVGVIFYFAAVSVAEPVKTFPELLKKVKEHREMIKDISGEVKYNTYFNCATEEAYSFIYADNEWQISFQSVRWTPVFITNPDKQKIESTVSVEIHQLKEGVNFIYLPNSGTATINNMSQNILYFRGKSIHQIYQDPIPFIGIDTYGWEELGLNHPYFKIIDPVSNNKTIISITRNEDLIVLSKYLETDSRYDLKLWIDPHKQYSVVRCEAIHVPKPCFDGHFFNGNPPKETTIDMMAIGNPPVYFPRQVRATSIDKNWNEVVVSITQYENIKINTGLTKDDVNIKLPKSTLVKNELTGKLMKTTCDEVTLDQILAGENVDLVEKEVIQPPVVKTVTPPPPPRKPNPFLNLKLWGYILGFFWVGLMALLIVKYITRDKRIILD